MAEKMPDRVSFETEGSVGLIHQRPTRLPASKKDLPGEAMEDHSLGI